VFSVVAAGLQRSLQRELRIRFCRLFRCEIWRCALAIAEKSFGPTIHTLRSVSITGSGCCWTPTDLPRPDPLMRRALAIDE
jgi:hypothetical protein